VIPISRFNDNSRDCPDGSDEPGTSVGPATPFYCRNQCFIPSEIPRWRVGDGVCDCCDGSDEDTNPHKQCGRRCQSMAATWSDTFTKISVAYMSGVKQSIVMQVDGDRILQKNLVKKAEALTKIHELALQIQSWKALPVVEMPAPEAEDDDDGDRTVATRLLSINRLWRFTFSVSEERNPYRRVSKSKQQQEILALEEEITRLQKDLEKIEKIEKAVAQGLPRGLLSVWETKFVDGNFSIVLGRAIFQGRNPLGHFNEWANGTIWYKRGKYCPSMCKARSAEIRLTCGQHNYLRSVQEVGECDHRGVFVTPVACTSESLVRLNGMTMEKLLIIAHDMKITG
jgi:hypothetical protein